MTFKDFLVENGGVPKGSLSELALRLYLQKKYKLSKTEAMEVLCWCLGELEWEEMDLEVVEAIFDYYAGEIPYGVVKDMDPDPPAVWVWNKLEPELRSKGFDL